LKLKRLSIFIICAFIVSILSVNYDHREDRIFQNDSLFFDTFNDNSDFSTCDTYQVLLISRFIATIIIEKKIFTPRNLTCKFITRAPPA